MRKTTQEAAGQGSVPVHLAPLQTLPKNHDKVLTRGRKEREPLKGPGTQRKESAEITQSKGRNPKLDKTSKHPVDRSSEGFN